VTETGAAQVDLVVRAELLAAAVATGDFDGAAVAEDARPVFDERDALQAV
jgi:hypothetical protein